MRVAHIIRHTRTCTTSPSLRHMATTPNEKLGIVMLNMGGPSSLDGETDGVGPFLQRLFSDPEIISLGPLQNWLGPGIARRRTPAVREQYATIGGKSPIRDWTSLQGEAMCANLQSSAGRAATAYPMFRYAPPLTEDVLQQMAADGITRAVAFSQYPHYSCTTTGSSLNHLWRTLHELGLQDQFKWSVIDRWPTHPTFIASVADRVAAAVQRLPQDVRHRAVVVFTAHSLPMRVVNKGDPYPAEVAATCSAVIAKLADPAYAAQAGLAPPAHDATTQAASAGAGSEAWRPPWVLAWQSKVGPLPWLGPSTGNVLAGLGRQGVDAVVAVPIAFTSDHIETLYEIDHEYAEDAAKAGITHFTRAEALNGSELFATALSDIVEEHLAAGQVATHQYGLNCAACENPACRSIVNPAKPYAALRHSTSAACDVPAWP